jgi:hypothetical protein
VRVTVGTLRRKLAPTARPDALSSRSRPVVGAGYRLREP